MRRLPLVISFAISVASIAGPSMADDQALIQQAEAAVAVQLKDPDSAKFTEVAIHNGAVCGLYNAKNSYGGYTGAAPFFYMDDETVGAVIEPTVGSDPSTAEKNAWYEFHRRWHFFCEEKPGVLGESP